MIFNQNKKIKICVFTVARSDYFLLRPLLYKMQEHECFELQLIVSGMHLSTEYGETWKIIAKDGFDIKEKISMQLSSNTPQDIVASMGLGMVYYASALNRSCPDLVVVLGDRFEMMSFTTAAYIMKIPIAHIHGGELTYGSFDDGLRHCITKMSSLHFPATEKYRQRIIQMGEHPESIFNVGALAVENINGIPAYDITTLAKKLNIPLQEKFFLVTFHPETSIHSDVLTQIEMIIGALSKFPEYQVIWTISNADPQGKAINNLLRTKADIFFLIENLGGLYISILKKASAVIGNSSSGIIEAPIAGVPTVNVGSRQQGRLRVSSIIDCSWDVKEISDAISRAIRQNNAISSDVCRHPYGDGNTSFKIIEKLVLMSPKTSKDFYDLSDTQ